MTPEQRIGRAARAQGAWDEFIAPMIDNLREEYTNRVAEVAATELHPANRADKITTLSVALRVLATLESGMKEAIRDGDLARKDKIRADNVERMSDAQQRLLKIAGAY